MPTWAYIVIAVAFLGALIFGLGLAAAAGHADEELGIK